MSAIDPLQWVQDHDEQDRPYWEAVSIYHDDACPFYFRIKQLDGRFHEASDAELMIGEPHTWPTFNEAISALQADHDRMYSAEVAKTGEIA